MVAVHSAAMTTPSKQIQNINTYVHVSIHSYIYPSKYPGKPTGKRHLRRPRRRWEDNIRMDLEEISINAMNWVDSAQDRRAFVNAAWNLRVP